MFWNAWLLALRAIRRNVLRSSLTMLGIVIGVAAVITMVNLGQGATAQVTAQIASLGSNLLILRPGQRFGPGQRNTAPPFRIDDATAVATQIGSLAAAAPTAAQQTIAVYGNENWSTSVTGTTPEYFQVRNWAAASGRTFTASELRAGKAVCLIGATLVRELYRGQDPLDSALRLKKVSCQVIGVLAAKGQSAMGSDQDDVVIMPLRTFWRRIAGNQDVNLIHVSARDGVATQQVKRDIELLMRERRHISPAEDDNFSVMDMQEIAATLADTTKILTMLLGTVAAVSLLVGGIGIMNIMLVSVTERTREIGIRLAIGALEREVMMQFLVEAVVLSSLGGVVGVVLALAATFGLSGVLGVPFVFSGGIVVIAVVFAAAVGVVFGYFPALTAARLNPIEALRHE
ncbi:MAG: ABC transporter permease [Gammaproteobacteria bacterium]|nr:ABC transporter permease [Gammaproteobacteria bacterium]